VREARRRAAWAERYCTKLKWVSKQLIINEILVEAAGVQLFRVLITRNLLIPGSPTTAKKAPLPDPLYVYCTKILSLWSSAETTMATVSHRFDELDRERTMLIRSFSGVSPRAIGKIAGVIHNDIHFTHI
jgi:hypothetical protein